MKIMITPEEFQSILMTRLIQDATKNRKIATKLLKKMNRMLKRGYQDTSCGPCVNNNVRRIIEQEVVKYGWTHVEWRFGGIVRLKQSKA